MNNKKNNLPLTIDGVPNLSNPSVLAGMLDCVGMNLTMTLNEIGTRNRSNDPNDPLIISADQAHVLIASQKLLRMIRDAVSVCHDVADNQVDICFAVLAELEDHRAKVTAQLNESEDRIRKIAREMGLEAEIDAMIAESRQAAGYPARKTSAADAADAILRDLRETGTIGGTRAV